MFWLIGVCSILTEANNPDMCKEEMVDADVRKCSTQASHTHTTPAFCLNIDIFFYGFSIVFFMLQIEYISSEPGFEAEKNAVIDNFRCLLYPTNLLNCSWSFDTFQVDPQLSVYFRCFHMCHTSYTTAFFEHL